MTGLAPINQVIPQPSNATPAAVADTGNAGTDSQKYAMEGHVHPSKLRKQRVVCTTATLVWTYPTPFDVGVVPIVNGIAETVTGVTDLYNIQVDGTPNNVSCTFRVTRYQQSVAALLGLTILSLNTSAGSIFIHAEAFQP